MALFNSRLGAGLLVDGRRVAEPLVRSLLVRPDRDAILKALEQVIDPELRRPVTELDMVRDVLVEDDGSVSVTIALTVAGCPLRRLVPGAGRAASSARCRA